MIRVIFMIIGMIALAEIVFMLLKILFHFYKNQDNHTNHMNHSYPFTASSSSRSVYFNLNFSLMW